MATVKKEEALVMVFPKNPAAQDAVNGLGNLTRGRVAMEKGMAALGALHIQAFWSRRSLMANLNFPSQRSASVNRAPVRGRSIMPGPSFKMVA